MVGHTDTEMIAMKEEVYSHRPLETGGTACHIGPHGSSRVTQEAEGPRGSMGESPGCGLHRKEWVRQGNQNRPG